MQDVKGQQCITRQARSRKGRNTTGIAKRDRATRDRKQDIGKDGKGNREENRQENRQENREKNREENREENRQENRGDDIEDAREDNIEGHGDTISQARGK